MMPSALRGTACAGAIWALALSGCTINVAPAPASTLQTPASWRTNAGAATDEMDRGLWWRHFGDPVLDALVTEARAHNADVRTAASRVAQYRAMVAAARANQLPAVSVDGGPGRARQLASNGQPVVTNLYQAEFQASYEIDAWGRLAAQTGAATATYQAEQANAGAIALSVEATVVSGYISLRGLDAQLELTEATLKLRQQSRDLAQRQFERGYSSRLEWLQAQAEYQSTAEQLPQLRRSIFEQENALSLLTGKNPGTVARGLTLDQLTVPVVPAGLPSELVRRRPDIARAEFNLISADATLRAARDQLLPSFKLTGSGGIQNAGWHDFLNAPTALWRLAGTVAAPVFDGGRARAQAAVAAAQRDQAVFAYESAVRSAFSETENSLGAIYQLNEQAVQNDARRATAVETLRIAHNRYRNGYASYLEELDAQRTLFAADVGRLQLKTSVLQSTVNLYRALGGGWAVR